MCGLAIRAIDGPDVAINGSSSMVVLDCDYDINDWDKSGLVVKWFYNDHPFPVYQWIPNNEPQVQT